MQPFQSGIQDAHYCLPPPCAFHRPPVYRPAGPAADGVIGSINVLNAAVGRMVTAALWVSPLGVGSLICSSILKACDLTGVW